MAAIRYTRSTDKLLDIFKLGGGFRYFFIFTPIPGEMIQFDEHIFQMGWFNHQPVNLKNLKIAAFQILGFGDKLFIKHNYIQGTRSPVHLPREISWESKGPMPPPPPFAIAGLIKRVMKTHRCPIIIPKTPPLSTLIG